MTHSLLLPLSKYHCGHDTSLPAFALKRSPNDKSDLTVAYLQLETVIIGYKYKCEWYYSNRLKTVKGF